MEAQSEMQQLETCVDLCPSPPTPPPPPPPQDQYQLCYRAALEYLGSFDHYAT